MKIPHPTEVRIVGPLAAHKDGLAANLRTYGYAPPSSTALVRLMAHLSRWLGANDLKPEELCAARMDEFLQHRRRAGYSTMLSPRGLQPVVSYLRSEGIVPAEKTEAPERAAVDKSLDSYETFLLHERALTSKVVRQYRDVARDFLLAAFHDAPPDHKRLTAGHVSSYILAAAGTSSVGYAKLKVTALRSFLRCLHIRGESTRDLTGALPPIIEWRLSGLPKALTHEESSSLLRSCDLRTSIGRRAYAVLSLMLRLGLRAFEVASLTLDDVNWSRGEILVRGKGRRLDPLPLPQAVGEAVAAYLQRGRPRSQSRSLFLGGRAPYDDMTPSMVKQIVSAAGHRCGFQHLGTHRLRHTAATDMLRNGASLPEIGQVLRQRSVDTTAIYAKVDFDSLRTVCRPWPGAAS